MYNVCGASSVLCDARITLYRTCEAFGIDAKSKEMRPEEDIDEGVLLRTTAGDLVKLCEQLATKADLG
jgi:hypothetical protein